MTRRSLRRRAGVAGAATLLLCTACSHTVTLDTPHLGGAAARACATLVKALPDSVADQSRRTAKVTGGYGAAWGDPAIELRCGVARPKGFDRQSSCQTTDGVDWYVPLSQQSAQGSSLTMTAVGRAVYVEVKIPSDYFPPATAMVDLAPAMKTVRSVKPCL